jgi:hypothetical protein
MATSRRDFLKASASMAAGVAASRSMARAETEQTPATQAAPTAALLARTATPAAAGAYELFKTSSHFDGTAHNPDWLG